MLLALSSYHYIIIFSATIIISYFFTLYAKKTGVPSVLMLIGLGFLINYLLLFLGVEKPDLLPILEVLGAVGLVLILLEAALDLKILKKKLFLIFKSLLVSFLGLAGTAYMGAYVLSFLLESSLLNNLLYTIPMSILSSAIILPSIGDLEEEKKEFMVYESTFSDIWGIVGFYSVLNLLGSTENIHAVQNDIFNNLLVSFFFSVIISYLLIFIFQKITSSVKLFLLISVLLLLYSLGNIFNLSSLLIILIFGLVLNNYRLFFVGGLKNLINTEQVEKVLSDVRLVSAESAFVMRTFFFIIFGWSVSLASLFNLKVIFLGSCLLAVIYLVRLIVLFVFNGKNIFPQVFLAPRGLITILLFFAIPEEFSVGSEFKGVLLFVILSSCLIMSWSLVKQKSLVRRVDEKEGVAPEKTELNTDLENLEE